MTDNELDTLEAKIIDEQAALIEAKYGSEAAGNANYGWAVISETDGVGVCSKVYLETGPVLLSSEGTETGITHEWAAY